MRQAMMTLCDRTEHDVRACLNTLQFLAKRTRKIGNLDVRGVQCGQKDMVKSAFGVWQELFSHAVRHPACRLLHEHCTQTACWPTCLVTK